MTKIIHNEEMYGNEFVETIPELANIWESMNVAFLHRLRGELCSLIATQKKNRVARVSPKLIRQTANRIHNAYVQALDASDDFGSLTDQAHTVIRVFEQGLPNNNLGGGGRAKLETAWTNEKLSVQVHSYGGRYFEVVLNFKVSHEEDVTSYYVEVDWTINFLSDSQEASLHVKDLLDANKVRYTTL